MANFSTNLNKSSTINQFLKSFEPIFTVISLFIFSRAIIVLIISNGASEGDGHVSSADNYTAISIFLVLIYLITFALLTLRWRKVLAVLVRDRYISVYLGIFLLSYFWSDFPQETLRPSISGIGATAFGLYLATRYTIKEQVKLLFWTFTIMLLTSLLFAVAIPRYAFMAALHDGAFRGVFTHKNLFGPTMVMGLLIFLIKAFDNSSNVKNNSWLPWCYACISIALIILSRSSNALITLAIMLPLFFVARIFRTRYEVMTSAFLTLAITGLIGITWFQNNQDVFFAALGKDPTLTGRTRIWQYVWDMIQQRPWLGYGYQGFWHNLEGASAYVNLAFGPFSSSGIPSSHNGFLEILLATGFVGLSVFFIGFVINFVKAIVLIRISSNVENLWPLLYLTYILAVNIAETSLASLNNMHWVLYSATIFSLTNVFRSQPLKDNKSVSIPSLASQRKRI